jgi:hypothetical protein
MSGQYDNTNRGSLGKNKRKEKDTHPDYAGQINVDGRDYWLSAWLKTNNQTGEKFFSLAVKPKEVKAGVQGNDGFGDQPPARRPAKDDFDDSIPF